MSWTYFAYGTLSTTHQRSLEFLHHLYYFPHRTFPRALEVSAIPRAPELFGVIHAALEIFMSSQMPPPTLWRVRDHVPEGITRFSTSVSTALDSWIELGWKVQACISVNYRYFRSLSFFRAL